MNILNFGERLKNIRREKKISQQELGKRLGVSQQTIAQYEKIKDTPKSATVFRLANALELDDLSKLIDISPATQVMWKNRHGDLGKAYLERVEHEDRLNHANSSQSNPKALNENNSDLPFAPSLDEIAEYYNKLTNLGKNKLLEYAEDLADNPKYQADK